MSHVTIRPYRDGDRDDVRDVCIRTGDSGGDARASFADPGILPALFAEPYLHLEPELAFVADSGARVVGYILGTRDTPAFAARMRAQWLPRVAGRFPAPDAPPRDPQQFMADLLHHPERMVHPELAEAPAHLHIDLLPGHQRAGHGRRLMARFLAALAERGAAAVHVGVSPANTDAITFYRRLGFREVTVAGSGARHLIRATGPLPGG